MQHQSLRSSRPCAGNSGIAGSVRSSSPCSTEATRPTWSATCSWRSSRRLQRTGVARAPSNHRCGPGIVKSDAITDVVQRVPVTCEENPFATEKDSWPLSRGSEGTSFHKTGDGNFPCRRRSNKVTAWRQFFFAFIHVPLALANTRRME